MALYLLDDTLKVEIFYEASDREFADNICISIIEECPEDEKVFIHDQTNLYLTTAEACQFIEALQQAIKNSNRFCGDPAGN